MRDGEIREIQALGRINDFGAARAADFPPTSLGGKKFAAVKALVGEFDTLGEAQARAVGDTQAETEAKRAARLNVKQKMRAMRETAKAMDAEMPGTSDKFRLPRVNGDEPLINSARAFVTTATPLKDTFLQHEMPATFLDDLTAAIAEFENATNRMNLRRDERVSATAGLKDALARALRLRKELNPIVRNKYQDDPATLAVWHSASHVERAPKKKSGNVKPQPPK